MKNMDKHPTARQLEVLAALITHGSQAKAAQSLSISQHTVNGHIRNLTSTLNTHLLGATVYVIQQKWLLFDDQCQWVVNTIDDLP